MRIVETYLTGTAKGCCYLCQASPRDLPAAGGGTRRELVLDTGVEIDFEGRLALCECCIREAGNLVGLVDAGALRQEQLDHAETAEYLERCQDKLAAALTALGALRTLDALSASPANDAGGEDAAAADGEPTTAAPRKAAAARKTAPHKR